MSSQSPQSARPGITLPALVDDVIEHPYLPLVIKKVFDVCGSKAFESSDLIPHFLEAELGVTKWQRFAETEGFKAACDVCKTSTDAIMFIMVTALNRVRVVGSEGQMALHTTITTGRKALSNTRHDPHFDGNTCNRVLGGAQETHPTSKGESIHRPAKKKQDVKVQKRCVSIHHLNGIQKPTNVARTPLSEKAKAMLERWFQDNFENPYPTSKEKEHLADLCGVTLASVNNWFGNKRMRIKRKMLQVDAQESGHIANKVLAPKSKWNALVVAKMTSQEGREVLANATGTTIHTGESVAFDKEEDSMQTRE